MTAPTAESHADDAAAVAAKTWWGKTLGNAGGSAAFGPPTPVALQKARGYYFDVDAEEEQEERGGRSSRSSVRQSDDEASSRSKSTDSDATLVENEVGKMSLDDEEEEDIEEADFVVDGSSRGIVRRQDVRGWRMTDRELYHRLQNHSQFPRSTIAIARRRLFVEMANVIDTADFNDPASILSLPERFDADKLASYLLDQHNATSRKFGEYSKRRNAAFKQARSEEKSIKEARKAGCEMFDEGKEQCIAWLNKASVVKYVDGSWLAHLLRSTTGCGGQGFGSLSLDTQRRAARASWQVMSEELGDGDLDRSHVAIYEALMDRLDGVKAPKGEDREFTAYPPAGDAPPQTKNKDSRGNDRCWHAAVVQLILSASPVEFLPESLGFNMAYESLPYHLLVSAREIEELIDRDAAYYFWLHVSIDNADSGHSAMARLAVVDFLHSAREERGQAFADEMWARVKLGYALADAVPTTPLLKRGQRDETPRDLTSTALTSEDVDPPSPAADKRRQAVIDILRSKSTTAVGVHASVHAQLAGRSVSEWLNPEHIEENAPKLLDSLASSSVWVKPGDAANSRFVKEFEWGGKMFGAMTASEVESLKAWVNGLPAKQQHDDAEFAGVDIKQSALRVFEGYLERHNSTRETRFRSDEILRPIYVEGSAKGPTTWIALGEVVYSNIMARPDAQRVRFEGQDQLLVRLASTQASTLQQRKFTDNDLHALIPTLLIAAAPLEHAISASCGRLASPLGMACVKILRILLGFTEKTAPPSTISGDPVQDLRDVGCMGTDDVEEQLDGVWELVQQLNKTLESKRGTASQREKTAFGASAADLEPSLKTPLTEVAPPAPSPLTEEAQPTEKSEASATESKNQRIQVSLEDLQDRQPNQLGLAALVLHLGSDLWSENMPRLLGLSSVLVGELLSHADVLRAIEHEDQVQRMVMLTRLASAWIDYAIHLGTKELPRGVPDCDWTALVEQGRNLAHSGIVAALDDSPSPSSF